MLREDSLFHPHQIILICQLKKLTDRVILELLQSKTTRRVFAGEFLSTL
nr:MAG TPA: hypothetical protein [Caudoviricetes sp.]